MAKLCKAGVEMDKWWAQVLNGVETRGDVERYDRVAEDGGGVERDNELDK